MDVYTVEDDTRPPYNRAGNKEEDGIEQDAAFELVRFHVILTEYIFSELMLSL